MVCIKVLWAHITGCWTAWLAIADGVELELDWIKGYPLLRTICSNAMRDAIPSSALTTTDKK